MGCGSSTSTTVALGSTDTFHSKLPPTGQSNGLAQTMEEEESSEACAPDLVEDSLVGMPPVEPLPETKLDATGDNQVVPKDKIINKYLNAKVKAQLAELTIEELLAETEERMSSLSEQKDFTNEDTLDDLLFLRAATGTGVEVSKRVILSDRLSELGLAKLFKKIWAQGFNGSLFLPENKTVRLTMKFSMIIMWNCTDKSRKLCQSCVDESLYVDHLKFLRDPVLDPNDEKNVTNIYFIKGLQGILHNIIQTFEMEARELYRENGALEAYQKLSGSKNTMIRCKAELLLAYIISEDENELINSDESNFSFLLKILADALKTKGRQSKKWGFHAVEIIKGLNKLAANDANKLSIVNQGALPYYLKLLQPDCGSNEQMNSARGLWILAFKCREQILNETGCLEALQSLVNTTEDEGVRKQAMGALWILRNEANKDADIGLENERTSSRAQRKKKSDKVISVAGPALADSQQHIMISYQWQHKPMMLRIRDSLRDSGFRVWMDVDDMSGSILEAMALAVERAAVVIVCLSQKYKESPSCRTEAEYTFRLRKDIIPLRLQPKYQPDGWLGALSGNKLYFDFTMEDKFRGSVEALIKELGNRGRGLDTADSTPEVGSMPKVEVVPSLGTGPPGGNNLQDIRGWKPQDVKTWLQRAGLEKHQKQFEGFDGSLLMEYKSMQREAPEFFYTTLKDDMKFALLDILKFTKALKQL